jgi:hypothetical protein
MRPRIRSLGIDRRALLSRLALLPALSGPFLAASAQAQTVPPGGVLRSWNNGPAKQDTEAKKWLAAAKDPRWKRPYTDLTYQPMQEVMSYLRANGYKTYIVTGGGQDFGRVYSERIYGIPPEQVVGSAGGTTYGYDKDGKPILTKEPKLLVSDDNAGKPEGIHLMIGRRPRAAFGNSTGDRQMLEYTVVEGLGERADLGVQQALRRAVGIFALHIVVQHQHHQPRTVACPRSNGTVAYF